MQHTRSASGSHCLAAEASPLPLPCKSDPLPDSAERFREICRSMTRSWKDAASVSNLVFSEQLEAKLDKRREQTRRRLDQFLHEELARREQLRRMGRRALAEYRSRLQNRTESVDGITSCRASSGEPDRL